ncbi:RnfABCDGE type electron transport complex subunit G [bacterium]|nr:RnfABCDGE type electron transport complex subunit G [bacterium]
MKYILKLGLILMVYTVVAGLSLGFINNITRSKILEQEGNAGEKAQREVLPEASAFVDFTTNGGFEYKKGYADKDTADIVGYVVNAYGNGYSSTIRTIVGLDTTFTIEAIEIVYQEETPGLGTKCVEIRGDSPEPWFEAQFDGKKPDELLVDKDGGTIDAISGATITSRAVTNSVREAIEELKKHLTKGGSQ